MLLDKERNFRQHFPFSPETDQLASPWRIRFTEGVAIQRRQDAEEHLHALAHNPVRLLSASCIK